MKHVLQALSCSSRRTNISTQPISEKAVVPSRSSLRNSSPLRGDTQNVVALISNKACSRCNRNVCRDVFAITINNIDDMESKLNLFCVSVLRSRADRDRNLDRASAHERQSRKQPLSNQHNGTAPPLHFELVRTDRVILLRALELINA